MAKRLVMEIALTLTVIKPTLRATESIDVNRPSHIQHQIRGSIMESGAACRIGIISIHDKPSYMCRPFRAWFFRMGPNPQG